LESQLPITDEYEIVTVGTQGGSSSSYKQVSVGVFGALMIGVFQLEEEQ